MKLTESMLRTIIKEELSKLLNEAKLIPDGRGGYVEERDIFAEPAPKKSKLRRMPDGRGGEFYVDEKGNVVEPEREAPKGKRMPDGRGGEYYVDEPTPKPSASPKSDMVWMPDGRGGGEYVPRPPKKSKKR